MKLATSTGDFKFYVPSIAAAVESFKDSKFQFLNLEQTGYIPEFFSDNDDDYKKLADEWGNAAAYAGVQYVVSHAPCLHNLIPAAFENNMPYRRKPWEHKGETVTKLLSPPLELKKKAVDLLYETGKYILETYDCFEI